MEETLKHRNLALLLLQARECVMTNFRRILNHHGLTEQQWRVIRAMSASDRRLRPMDLSQMTFISMPSLSRLLKTLEGRQLIKRGRHVGDLRGSEFGLTPAGHAMVAEIAPHSEEIYAEIERLVGSEEVAQLYQLLELVVQRLGVPSEEDLGAD